MPPKHVLIAAGHGIRPDGTMDNGAYNALTKTKEHDLNVAVVTYCASNLANHNILITVDTNLFGRAKDPNWANLVKYTRTNNLKFDLALEVHHDSSNAKDAGFGILPKTINPNVTKLANSITAAFKNNGLSTKPSYKDVRGLGWLRSFSYPAIIWECAVTRAVGEDILQKRGDAIAHGILNWLKIPVVTDTGSAETIKRVQQFLGLPPTGVRDDRFNKALIAWKAAHKLYPSSVLTPYILTQMGL